jgi:hypothetical protein
VALTAGWAASAAFGLTSGAGRKVRWIKAVGWIRPILLINSFPITFLFK